VSARLEFAKIEAFIVSNDKFSLRLMPLAVTVSMFQPITAH
jgi:hypothetical protein